MANKKSKTKKVLHAVGMEMKMNPPKILAKTMRKEGKAMMEKQRVAILLSKARKAGAKIPKKKKGFNAGGFEKARRSYFGLGNKKTS